MSNDVGIVGMAVMGSNLALNIAEKGFKVACFNRTYSTTEAFVSANKASFPNLSGFQTMREFAASLAKPRKVLILVKAGAATDATIEQLTEVLEKGDIIVDTGNAHFRDQDKRAAKLEGLGLRFLGMGISGGEEGARKGPAFFPGGTLSVWEDIKPIVEAAAAKAEDGRPCVTMNGRGGAGSCVKMFHNAGEYAILQIWAEAYNIMKDQGLTNPQIAEVLQEWKARGMLESYMLNITIEAVKARDEFHTEDYLVSHTADLIGSKGTGLWSAQEALEAGSPAPSLNIAVISRQMSMQKAERQRNAAAAPFVSAAVTQQPPVDFTENLYHAVLLAIIASYAQMFNCLRDLDKVFNFGLDLPKTISTFRAGCILQGYLLQPMTRAFEHDAELPNLLVAFPEALQEGLPRYRQLLALVTANSATSTPVLSASLAYINAMFSGVLPYAQVVALQRDVFGRHGFKRLDREGDFNHTWPEPQGGKL